MPAKKKKAPKRAKKKVPKRAKKKAAKRRPAKRKRTCAVSGPGKASLVVRELGACADLRGKLYAGSLSQGRASIDLGTIVARNKAAGRRKFQTLVRKLR